MTTPADKPAEAPKTAHKPVPQEFVAWVRDALNAPDTGVAHETSRELLGRLKNLIAEQDAAQRNLQQLQQQAQQASNNINFLNGLVEGLLSALYTLEGEAKLEKGSEVGG